MSTVIKFCGGCGSKVRLQEEDLPYNNNCSCGTSQKFTK